MSETLSFIAGLIAGLGTNLLSWWLLAHWVTPKVEFSPCISRLRTAVTDKDQSGFRYRVKCRNAGRRGVIDIDLSAKLRIEGLRIGRTTVVVIPWTSDGEKRANVIRLPPLKPGERAARVLRFYINSVDAFRTKSIYPVDFRRRAEERALRLEDILGLGTKAWIQIAAFGYDEFSGARKLFLSKSYTAQDIKDGEFVIAGLDIDTTTDISTDNKKTDPPQA